MDEVLICNADGSNFSKMKNLSWNIFDILIEKPRQNEVEMRQKESSEMIAGGKTGAQTHVFARC
jgi:hypothetical protein